MDCFFKIVGGNVFYRRYAYINRTDLGKYGLLIATSYKDAQKTLGRGFRIRQVWLTEHEEREQSCNPDRKWEIVSLTFGSVAK